MSTCVVAADDVLSVVVTEINFVFIEVKKLLMMSILLTNALVKVNLIGVKQS